jgi:uncharacterized LabA/DUF88 family protein
MNTTDLPTNGGPQGSTAATANGEATGANRPRRRRHPARTNRPGDANAAPETLSDEKTEAVTNAAPAEAVENVASPPTETNRPARRRNNNSRTRGKAAPETTAETPAVAPSEPAPTRDTPNLVPTLEVAAPSAPTASVVVTPAPSAANMRVPSAPEPAATPPTPIAEATPASADEAPKHRYRFDRRTVAPTFPNAPASPTPTPGALRRPGAISGQLARTATPARPAPVPEPPPMALAPAPVVAPPLTPAPTPALPPKTPATPPPDDVDALPPLQAPTMAELFGEEGYDDVPPRRPEPRQRDARRPEPRRVMPRPVEQEIIVLETLDDDDDDDVTAESSTSSDIATTTNDRNGRGRRRRGRGRNGNGTHEAEERPTTAVTAVAPTLAPRTQSAPYSAPLPTAPAAPPEPPASPYGSPEPASARGFGATPRGVASEYRSPTPFTHSRMNRTNADAPMSANHLANIMLDAMQQQTDRLLAEQRRHSSSSMFTIAMPSTERVGVFVDVANLLYSSRSMRLPIDFGKLLTFLRSDRRLVRAHAYCPTSPEPYADQQFLQAVKGLGYRITTKDYKTFSSGAKKADLDLDLCMDIVRIVDAEAVDTVVLVSGDSDFLPLLEYCSDHGVRVEVAAFDESTAAILRQSCDLFVNLSVVEEIRADR